MKDTRPLYECDPELNTECRKTGCYIIGGPCFCTQHPEYSSSKKIVPDNQSFDRGKYEVR